MLELNRSQTSFLALITSLLAPLVLILLLAACLGGCKLNGTSSTEITSDDAMDSSGFAYLNEGDLTSDSTSISGSGTIVFVDEVDQEDNNFKLEFTLDDDGSLDLIAFADSVLVGGTTIYFSREGATLLGGIDYGAETIDISDYLLSVNALSEMTLWIDLYYDQSPPRILIWSEDDFSLDEVLYDNASSYPEESQGEGLYWGLSLNEAYVTTAAVSDPELE